MSLFNLPNKLTSTRLVLAFVFFICIWLHLWRTSLAVFAVAAFTDWLDGYIARRQGLISPLGRVYDPLVDKILICGAFIFLAEVRESGIPGDAGLNAWMIIILIAREFIVTGLRGFLEEKGVSFGADRLGKLKMVLQCAAIAWILGLFVLQPVSATAAVLVVIRDVLNWGTVAVTFISGANYVGRAIEHLS